MFLRHNSDIFCYDHSIFLGTHNHSRDIIAHRGKSLISGFQEFFASIGENYIWAVGLGAGISFCGVLKFS